MFGTESYYAARAGLTLAIFLPRPQSAGITDIPTNSALVHPRRAYSPAPGLLNPSTFAPGRPLPSCWFRWLSGSLSLSCFALHLSRPRIRVRRVKLGLAMPPRLGHLSNRNPVTHSEEQNGLRTEPRSEESRAPATAPFPILA